jgi:hypothetical protein
MEIPQAGEGAIYFNQGEVDTVMRADLHLPKPLFGHAGFP